MKCYYCDEAEAEKKLEMMDGMSGRLETFDVCVACFMQFYKKIGGKNMAGKMPSHRLVIGKRTIGTLWAANSKAGLAYHSGDLDITALRQALKDEADKVKKKQVRVSRDGATAEHETIRVALFNAQKSSQGSSSSSITV